MTAERVNLPERTAPVASLLNARGGWSLRETDSAFKETRIYQTNFCANYIPMITSFHISITNEGRVLLDSNSVQNFWADMFLHNSLGTTLPLVCVFRPVESIEDEIKAPRSQQGFYSRTWPDSPQLRIESPNVVRGLIERVRASSGLTLEEISPLLGVSRRSLQNWLSGRQISARKEQRLRALADILCSLPATDAASSRDRLLGRKPDGVRAYDLLAEGQFSAAHAMMAGDGSPSEYVPRDIIQKPLSSPLSPAVRMSTFSGGPAGVSGRVDIRRSGRLKR